MRKPISRNTTPIDPLRMLKDLGIGESCLRTNPVWCLKELARERTLAAQPILRRDEFKDQLPPGAWERFVGQSRTGTAPPDPRVVGLLVDRHGGQALVAPLDAALAAEWYVVPSLPFRTADLRNLLGCVLRAANVSLAEVCQDFLPCDIRDRLGREALGASMTVAGLLAVLDAASQHRHPLLRCACAVVQPIDGERLGPVERTGDKLAAVQREYEHGTLLIRPSRCPEAAAFDACFENVWRVDTIAGLARQLDDVKLLDIFRRTTPLDRHQIGVVSERVRVLIEKEHRHRDALALVLRLDEHPVAPDVPPSFRPDRCRTIGELYRHLGLYADAIRVAKREFDRVHRTSAVSYDDQIRAASDYAAAFYDPHQFERMVEILGPRRDALEADPRLVSPDVQVMVFNTLGRAQTALGDPGWEANFRRSMRIREQMYPFDTPRSANYLIHALLRHGRLKAAERLVDQMEAREAMSHFSRWMLRFLRADLARRQGGEPWFDSEMECQNPASVPSGHPFGFYFQATARQPRRTPEGAAERFKKAQEFFLLDVADGDSRNILWFLAECMRLAEAGYTKNNQQWQDALASLKRYTKGRAARGLDRYYRAVLSALGTAPTRDGAELLLERVPYF